jgi:hypothetical protein
MDKVLFDAVCQRFVGADRERSGIGTLSEKTLHLVLKNYLEPNEENHEVKVGRKVADIKSDDSITEIQTRSFNLLRPKLAEFLKEHKVTVVFPVAKEKYILWIDPESGEVAEPRKSPKKGSALDIFPELYRIKAFLLDSNIRFKILLLGVNELRLKNGWSKDGKRGSYKYESIPTALFEEFELNSVSDYKKLIPDGLPEMFTSKDFAKASKRTVYRAQTALNVLTHVGAVERVSKKGRSYCYAIN